MDQNEQILAALEKLSQQIERLPKHASRSTECNELFAALAKAQAKMNIAGKDNANAYFKAKYADLTDLVKASRPALTENSLSIIQQILTNDEGQSILYTILAHSSGQYISTQMRITPPKSDIQAMGSYISYLRRYSYACIVGVVASNEKEEDDGEAAMQEVREEVFKGTSPRILQDNKQQSYDTITKEQAEEIENEIGQYPEVVEHMLTQLQIQSIADIPKSRYRAVLTRAREIRQYRETTPKK